MQLTEYRTIEQALLSGIRRASAALDDAALPADRRQRIESKLRPLRKLLGDFQDEIAIRETNATASKVASRLSHVLPDSTIQPIDVFKGNQQMTYDVKAPSARYSTKRYAGKHRKTGAEVLRDGQPVELPSERDKAMTGVYFRQLALKKGYDIRPLDEHEQSLLKELRTESLWCGDVGGTYYTGHKLSDIYHTKSTELLSVGA